LSPTDDIATARVTPHEQAVFRELAGDEGAVLLQVGSGGYHGLNPMGSLIWGLLQQGPTVAELVEAVRARVSDPPDHLADEVVAFVVDLEERDLVVMTPPQP
jgi:hypothetical protein